MHLSYISALLLAPLALASPTPSSSAISINQRDFSAPLESRTQYVSQKIQNVVVEGHKVTEMCQKYKGGVWESVQLYRQFKTCYSSVQSAEKAASQSGPMSENESANVQAALEDLTPEFLELSKALKERKSMIKNSRYATYFASELEKLQKNVDGLYNTCQKKVTTPHQPKIKALGKEVDEQFEIAKKELASKSKARRSFEFTLHNEEHEDLFKRLDLPDFSEFLDPSEGFSEGLEGLPGSSKDLPGLSGFEDLGEGLPIGGKKN
ncbi:uncharacterized protein EAF01_007280 [Botrytis porri]|uniref:Uncharacterized protein n=1 Tax=Botrytis porri TaxID=87229 RepID=A0A4Z1KZF3_9HELO|nr:uncharacterized protein EAF01_007280 [Botrytis porri]KAF7901982.1 hypothetical protein EAF01_007280 [Botrytis porri]TGO89830.1 hypothetical protein BPOR_0092g00160 [Botrytis porri]